MSDGRYFRAQAHNNAWANHRLLGACERLSPEDLAATRTSFFPSIIHTLNHNLTVDWFYVSALEGASIGYAAFARGRYRVPTSWTWTVSSGRSTAA